MGVIRAAIVIASALVGLGCGSTSKPVHKKPAKPPTIPRKPVTKSAEPELLLGQMCPQVAAGRAAVLPLAFRAGIWTADRRRSDRFIAARTARQFTVLSWTGGRAGFFQVAGAASAGGRTWAVGSFAGSPPCVDGDGETIPECTKATGGCGLALARLEPAGGLGARPFEEDPEPLELQAVSACVDRDELAVDIDGDGKHELFERSSFLVAGRLTNELVAAKSARRQCEGRTAFAEIAAGVTLLAASDIDGDGRVELVVSRRSAGKEEWAVFRALQTPRRLERVAVAPAHLSGHSQSGSAPAAPR